MPETHVTNRQLLTALNLLREEVHIMAANTDAGLALLQQALADAQNALTNLGTQATNIETSLSTVLAQINSGEDTQVAAGAQTLETIVGQVNAIATALQTAAAAIPAPPATGS